MKSLKKSLEYCVELNCKKLHIMAGKRLEGTNTKEASEVFLSNLQKALPLLEEAGVVGLIEPINPWSVPNYNMDSFKEGLRIVK